MNHFHADQDDIIIVCAYGIAARSAVLQDGVVLRKEGCAMVMLPDDLLVETVHLYLKMTKNENTSIEHPLAYRGYGRELSL